MSIPSNLLPINNPLREELGEIPTSSIGLPNIVGGVPKNLLPVNASDISASFQSFTGQIPTVNAPQIPEFPILNTILPDRLFTTGSLDQVRARTLNATTTYLNGLPALPTLPSIPTTIVPRPRIPSYGQIKNFINTKIDRIKRQRQQASVKALNEELKRQENPFTYRQSIKNEQSTVIPSNILGRFNNQ
jgi:hypothetical protein